MHIHAFIVQARKCGRLLGGSSCLDYQFTSHAVSPFIVLNAIIANVIGLFRERKTLSRLPLSHSGGGVDYVMLTGANKISVTGVRFCLARWSTWFGCSLSTSTCH